MNFNLVETVLSGYYPWSELNFNLAKTVFSDYYSWSELNFNLAKTVLSEYYLCPSWTSIWLKQSCCLAINPGPSWTLIWVRVWTVFTQGGLYSYACCSAANVIKQGKSLRQQGPFRHHQPINCSQNMRETRPFMLSQATICWLLLCINSSLPSKLYFFLHNTIKSKIQWNFLKNNWTMSRELFYRLFVGFQSHRRIKQSKLEYEILHEIEKTLVFPDL